MAWHLALCIPPFHRNRRCNSSKSLSRKRFTRTEPTTPAEFGYINCPNAFPPHHFRTFAMSLNFRYGFESRKFDKGRAVRPMAFVGESGNLLRLSESPCRFDLIRPRREGISILASAESRLAYLAKVKTAKIVPRGPIHVRSRGTITRLSSESFTNSTHPSLSS
jgi:hypothetical protein